MDHVVGAGSLSVQAASGGIAELRGNHNIITARVNELAKDLLGTSIAVNVCAVKEVDTVITAGLKHCGGGLLVSLGAKRHRPEAEGRYQDTGVPKSSWLGIHGWAMLDALPGRQMETMVRCLTRVPVWLSAFSMQHLLQNDLFHLELPVDEDSTDNQGYPYKLDGSGNLTQNQYADDNGGGGENRHKERVRGPGEASHGKLIEDIRDD